MTPVPPGVPKCTFICIVPVATVWLLCGYCVATVWLSFGWLSRGCRVDNWLALVLLIWLKDELEVKARILRQDYALWIWDTMYQSKFGFDAH